MSMRDGGNLPQAKTINERLELLLQGLEDSRQKPE